MDYEKSKEYLRRAIEYVKKEFIPLDTEEEEQDIRVAELLDELVEELQGISFEPDQELIDEVNEGDEDDTSD